jgi:cyclopropane-fatty-acyl-phospholipid synthase
MLTLQLDVDELESQSFSSLLLKYNRWGICSIRADDYLSTAATLRSRVESILISHGYKETPRRISLVTMPRYFGYVFNPVSFFLCFDGEDKIVACITQVNNTFGETHIYPLVCAPTTIPVSWSFSKEFFVSPFFDTEGSYSLRVAAEGVKLLIKVDLERDGGKVFAASLEGDARPLSNLNLFKALLSYPLTLLLTMPRIHLQALVLFFRAKVVPFRKPSPSGPYTIKSNQNIIHRTRLAFLSILRAFRKV